MQTSHQDCGSEPEIDTTGERNTYHESINCAQSRGYAYYSKTLDQWFSTRGDFDPQEISGNV